MEPSVLDTGFYRYMLRRMFEYLSATEPANRADLGRANGAFVFGRNDLRLADVAAKLYHDRDVLWILVTGGVGKDSGDLKEPEAEFLGNGLVARGVLDSDIYREPTAPNGAKNCQFGLDLIEEVEPVCWSLIAVAHSVSIRRLVMMLRGEIDKRDLDITVLSFATDFRPNYADPVDALEIVEEYLRMADWPARYGYPHNDLSPDLVRFARELQRILKPLVAATKAESPSPV